MMNGKVGFIEAKAIDWDVMDKQLAQSRDINQYTNFGPVSMQLEDKLMDYFEPDILEPNRIVVACSSGTSALFALVEMHNLAHRQDLKWGVCSYSFHCNRQGPLRDAEIIDCDECGMLDIGKFDATDCNAMLVTNPFGIVDNLDEYKRYCRDHKKVLICDSCSAFDALTNHDVDQAFSFHHTKPWGFGEGGAVIINQENKNLFRALINFGVYGSPNMTPKKSMMLKQKSTNAKLSDVAAGFILQRLENYQYIASDDTARYHRVQGLASQFDMNCLGSKPQSPNTVPLLCPRAVNSLNNQYVSLGKYYEPLEPTPNATNIYSRIINFPCHSGIDELSDPVISECLSIFQ